jgi:type I restriction enzyme R subunit
MMTTHPKTEAETRADLIDPMLNDCGWKNGETDVIVRREFPISKGRILTGGKRGPTLSADYLLLYKNVKLGVIEAKNHPVHIPMVSPRQNNTPNY